MQEKDDKIKKKKREHTGYKSRIKQERKTKRRKQTECSKARKGSSTKKKKKLMKN